MNENENNESQDAENEQQMYDKEHNPESANDNENQEEDLLNDDDDSISMPQPADEEPPTEGETISLNAMFKDYWVDYASDVLLDRSVPSIDDGLKPVQRRILHSMKDLDDGRFNKVNSIVGHTMQYHPHGDASIKDALVNIGQKDLLIDCQGNWGNILTGDDAAAGRYIEARLSKFAKEVVFNAKTTQWKPSYDGRHQEPISLPIKFPLLLAQGTKGIAVTLTSVILPYNFCELIEASIKILKDEPFEILPDFPTGGLIDVSRYNDAAQGGRLRIRAKMHYDEKRKGIVITEVPYSVTTGALIESIRTANDKGKIKIKKVDDYTTSKVEILVSLPPNVSPDQTIDALYAFTCCQISFSPQTCVVVNNKPVFLTASEILRHSTLRTKDLLRQELEIQLAELEDRWHWVSLEKLFFEKRIYKVLENNSPTWEEQVTEIERKFDPYRKLFRKEITRDDVLKLCEKPVRKISKFDIKKAEDEIADIEINIDETKNHLIHLTEYSITYFHHILDKYGKGRERKTEIRNFEDIESTLVAVANEKLYVNYTTGFAGYNLKKEEGSEYACDCSRMDDIIVFRRDGSYLVTKVQEKGFVGSTDCKEIIYIAIFRKSDTRTVYNTVYRDGAFGLYYVKRFSVTGVIRDHEYTLTLGTKGSKVIYFTANPNGEAEVITIHHASNPKLKRVSFDFNFADLKIKGRKSMGNQLTKNAIRNINKKEAGISTFNDARQIWFDESIKRLNVNGAGLLLGDFKGKDKILTLMQSGYFKTYNFDLANHFDDDLLVIRKYNPHTIITIVYRTADNGSYYVKRFVVEDFDKKLSFLEEGSGDTLITYSLDTFPRLELRYDMAKTGKKSDSEQFDINEFIAIKGYKAKGKRLTTAEVEAAHWLESLPEPILEPDPEEFQEEEKISDPFPDDNDNSDDSKGHPDGIQGTLF